METTLSVPTAALTAATAVGVLSPVTASAVRVGNRLEVDLTSLDIASCIALGCYYDTALDLWDRLAGRQDVEMPSAVALLRRELVCARQSSNADLTDVFAQIKDTPLAELAEVLTDSTLDTTLLADAIARVDASGTVEHDKSFTTVTVTLSGDTFAECFGGPPCPGELARIVTIRVSHAAWRDRRVRRLVEVSASADELWPARTVL